MGKEGATRRTARGITSQWGSEARHAGRVVAVVLTALCATAVGGETAARAQESSAPEVLLVTAHPDDEAMFAGSVYRITHHLGGAVDLALVTDGSGGFSYAHLAEPIYGLELTDEEIARHHLPAVRKRELMEAGDIVGIGNYFFLDQLDHAYTENVDTVLTHVWHRKTVRSRLEEIMRRGDYDFVFVHLPVPDFHAHHVAASILALEAASAFPEEARPVVLGSFIGGEGAPPWAEFSDYAGLAGYPVTRVRTDVPPFVFDRTQPVRENGELDHQIVVNWLIAEHKTQGMMQRLVNAGTEERFWYFEANGESGLEKTRRLFERMSGSE